MASINQVMLLGNVGKEPTVRYLENNSKVAMFSLATTEYYKDKQGQRQEVTEWHSIVAFGTFATVTENYVHKGTQVCIIGKLRTREYEQNGQRKWTTEVVVQNLQLCGSRQELQAAGMINTARQMSEQRQGYQQQPAAPAQPQFTPQSVSQMAQQAAPAGFTDPPTDDLPF